MPTIEVTKLSQSLGVLVTKQSSFEEGDHDKTSVPFPACGLMHEASPSKKNDIACFEVDTELEEGEFEETLFEGS